MSQTPHHGHGGPTRDLDPAWGLRTGGKGGYYRALPGLEPLRADADELAQLAQQMRDEVPQRSGGWGGGQQPPDDGDNPTIPAAYTYVGQFIDHDLTFDATASSDSLNRIDDKPNLRTPAFDLDSVYGLGPEAQPYLYDGPKLRTSNDGSDLPRLDGVTAVVGDPRNDENAIVARVHLALLNYHNTVVDHLQDAGVRTEDLFEEARRVTRWVYQYACANDYLPRTVGAATHQRLTRGPGVIITWPFGRALPIEFAGAAYRFGHTQVRPDYQLAPNGDLLKVFPDLRGGRELSDTDPFQWRHIAGTDDDGNAVQPTRKIDTRIAASLFALFGDGEDRQPPPQDNLALRNLRKGVLLSLPSGQSTATEIARRLQAAAASPQGAPWADDLLAEADELTSLIDTVEPATASGSPMWHYLLAEAEAGGGENLGPTAGRLVGETFLALLANDERSYWARRPFFAPTVDGDPLTWLHILTGAPPDGVDDVG